MEQLQVCKDKLLLITKNNFRTCQNKKKLIKNLINVDNVTREDPITHNLN